MKPTLKNRLDARQTLINATKHITRLNYYHRRPIYFFEQEHQDAFDILWSLVGQMAKRGGGREGQVSLSQMEEP